MKFTKIKIAVVLASYMVAAAAAYGLYRDRTAPVPERAGIENPGKWDIQHARYGDRPPPY